MGSRAGPKLKKYGKKKYSTSRRKALYSSNSQAMQMYRPLSVSMPDGLPRHMWVKLRYASTATGTTDAVGFVTRQLRLNGIYDPDATLGGHQPYNYDQLNALYSNSTVTKCRVSAAVVTDNPSMIAMTPATTSPVPTSITTQLERAGVVSAAVSATNPVTISRTYKVAEIFGCPAAKIMDENSYSAAAGALPTNQAYVNLTIGTGNPASQNYSIDFILEYTVKFWELTPQAAS